MPFQPHSLSSLFAGLAVLWVSGAAAQGVSAPGSERPYFDRTWVPGDAEKVN